MGTNFFLIHPIRDTIKSRWTSGFRDPDRSSGSSIINYIQVVGMDESNVMIFWRESRDRGVRWEYGWSEWFGGAG